MGAAAAACQGLSSFSKVPGRSRTLQGTVAEVATKYDQYERLVSAAGASRAVHQAGAGLLAAGLASSGILAMMLQDAEAPGAAGRADADMEVSAPGLPSCQLVWAAVQ
jgi:hypothetical protein